MDPIVEALKAATAAFGALKALVELLSAIRGQRTSKKKARKH